MRVSHFPRIIMFASKTTSTFGSSTTGSKTTSTFGSSSTWNKTTGTSTFGGFGANKGLAQTTKYEAKLKPNPIFERLYSIRCAYDPSSKGYKFCYVFYNKKIPKADLPKCPENIELNDWVKIMKECPDPEHLVPAALYGFEQLNERVNEQKEMEKELTKRMELVQAKLREMTSFYATELCGALERIKQNTKIISQLMMEVVEIQEVQRNQGINLTEEERKMLNKLEDLRLDLNRPGVYNSAISNLRLKSQMLSERKQVRSKMAVDRETLRALATALKSNQDAVEALETTTKKVKRTVDSLDTMISELQ
jgi:hypothetical protein